MRDPSLQDRLRNDAPAWRDAIAAGTAAPAARMSPRLRPAHFIGPALAAAAVLAMAGFVALQLNRATTSPARPATHRAAATQAPVPLPTPADLTAWATRFTVAPPLQLPDPEALMTDPLRAEAGRLRADVASAVGFVVAPLATLVPGDPAADPAGPLQPPA